MAAVKPVQLSPGSAEPAGVQDLDVGLARRFLYYMLLMREVEERIERKLYRQGKVVGGVYVGRGQEAIPVGAGLAAAGDDVLFPSHRDLALFFIRGVETRRIFAQYMGRVGGLTAGRDGNMHMGDLKLNIVSIISAMAASVPVAAGAALALRYQGSSRIAWCFFGDGATSRGDWHEGVNMASVLKVPVVFVCNNNAYAYSTPVAKQMGCANVADRAPGYGIPGEIVDGNDVFAVFRAADRAARWAREGRGPYLIECKTFRMTGHSAHDPADYVPAHLWEEWRARDPIDRLKQRMVADGMLSADEIRNLHQGVLEEVEAAVQWAEASPLPNPAGLLENVYDTPAKES